MKHSHLNLMTAGAALALMAADTGTGSGTGPADHAATTTDPVLDPANTQHVETTAAAPVVPKDEAAAGDGKAEAKAARAAAKEAKKAKGDDDDEPKSRYEILHDFHDTTTGRTRKKGRTLLATEKRAGVLDAAGVIDKGEPLPDDDDDDDDDAAQDAAEEAEAAKTRQAQVAPVGLDGPVDQAVAVTVSSSDNGVVNASEPGNPAADSSRVVDTTRVPAVVTGGRGKTKA